ncbi:MAG TPA: TlpA disulfide reductase family protein, partial [Chitinophagaceae bacterium]|nr:TlpA disulfide reductase family protein [Chitinophagaceae bacterium]
SLVAIGRRDNFKFQELKGWILPVYTEEIQEINIWFLTAYPRSYVSADVILNCISELTTDSIKLFYDRLDDKVRNSYPGKYIAEILEKRKIGMPGTTAPAFSASDINGVELRLEGFKGKYVLLDFWGSWCLPCRKLNPHLKELYAQYGPKGFEVIGVAADDRTPDAWKKAVAQDGLPWRHVLAGSISGQYNIHELPTQILIDSAGKIIARYGGGQGGEEHAALDKKLETIFK